MKWVLGSKQTSEISTFQVYLLRDIVRKESSVRADMVIALALMDSVRIAEQRRKQRAMNVGETFLILSKITNVRIAIRIYIVYFLADEKWRE